MKNSAKMNTSDTFRQLWQTNIRVREPKFGIVSIFGDHAKSHVFKGGHVEYVSLDHFRLRTPRNKTTPRAITAASNYLSLAP